VPNMRNTISIGLLIFMLTFSFSCQTSPVTDSTISVSATSQFATDTATTISTIAYTAQIQATKPSGTTLTISRITDSELKQKMDNGDYIILVDTRESNTYELAYLPEARNIPSTPTPARPIEEIKMLLNLLPIDTLIVFYGDKEDASDANYLGQLLIDIQTGHKFKDIRVLPGGYPGWLELGYPIRTTPGFLV
jgi:rhodanese-related sulfurtransferase